MAERKTFEWFLNKYLSEGLSRNEAHTKALADYQGQSASATSPIDVPTRETTQLPPSPSGGGIPSATGREPTPMERIEALVLGGMGYDEALAAVARTTGVEAAKAGVPALVQSWKDADIDSALLYRPDMNVTEEDWLGMNDEERAFTMGLPRVGVSVGEEGEEGESATDALLRAFLEGEGAGGAGGGGISDIGPNQMLIYREQIANMVIDLMGDLLNREVSRHTMARDYVDRLLETAGMTVPEGMKYGPGREPGGASDVIRRIAGITGEAAFPREIQTTPIPTDLLKPSLTPHDTAISQAIEEARKASEAVGLKSGGVVSTRNQAGKLLGFAGGFGGQMSAYAARELLGRPTGGYDPYAKSSGFTDPYASKGGGVQTGSVYDELQFLRDTIAAETALEEARVSGYMPSGAPTLEMQRMENDYKSAIETASIYAAGTVEAAQASAAATEAAAALHAAAARYAADQGLKGDEVQAAATRYVADVQARTAGERLAFDKAAKQAELAANPRTIFESVFLNRGLQAPATAKALQQQVTPPGTFDVVGTTVPQAIPTTEQALAASPIPAQQQASSLLTMRGMGGGGKVYEGPIIARVGERSKKSKTKETDEYALLAPGSVIAPRNKGEKPTMRNAVASLFQQITKSKPSQPAAGQAGLVVDPWQDYFKKAGAGGLPAVPMQRGGTVKPYTAFPTAGSRASGQARTPINRTQLLDPSQMVASMMSLNEAPRPTETAEQFAARRESQEQRALQFVSGRRVTPSSAGGGGQTQAATDGGVTPTQTPGGDAFVPTDTAVVPTTQIVGDISTDVLPAELLEAPAFGGRITSSLMRPMAVRGAFGKSKEQLSDIFNALGTNAYDLAKLSPDELQARQSILSLLGIPPETYFEASRRATTGAYGQPLAGQGSYARQTAGRLLG